MDDLGQFKGVSGGYFKDHHLHQSYAGKKVAPTAPYHGRGQTTSVHTPGDTSTFQTVDDYSTIITRKDLGLEPKNILSEQNVHRHAFNQQVRGSSYQGPLLSQPPAMITTNIGKTETRTESSKSNFAGIEPANQRDSVPVISTTNQNDAHMPTFSYKQLGTTPTGANTVSTPRSPSLDLKHNDNAFQVIASLIIDRFDRHLRLKIGSITITVADRHHLDRVVPDKKQFTEAVMFRLKICPEHSMKPIDVITRKCRALGLDREGSQNILNAAVGTIVRLNVDEQSIRTERTTRVDVKDDLARQQLTAELREASNLMAESVTPEASQFWRKHVVELQAKLRALHENVIESHSIGQPHVHGNADAIMKSNERLLASLWQNTGYVPPNQEESRAPSVQRNELDTDRRDLEVPKVDVVSPADLPAGFQFEAEIDNKRFIATVPEAGVRKGETFSCQMKEMSEADIPVVRWKDGLFDCLKHGPFHPMLLNSLFCPLLGLSQVMSRLRLDFTGKKLTDRTPRRGLWSTRRIMVSIIFFWLAMNVAIIFGFEYKLHNFVHLSSADIASLILVNGLMMFFTVYATMNTRYNLREEYHIGAGRLGSRTEDFAISAFCLPLSIAQMGRHTASYEEHRGVCCHETGIYIEA